MKPTRCINCGKNIWIELFEKDGRPKIEVAFDRYCKSCKVTAQRTSNILTRKRKEKRATEQLDIDEVTRLREWL